jgi:hypothetical protein
MFVSTGCKRNVVGTDNLVEFVKGVNYEYLACVKAQDKGKFVWRNEVLSSDIVRETKIVQKDVQSANMNNKTL